MFFVSTASIEAVDTKSETPESPKVEDSTVQSSSTKIEVVEVVKQVRKAVHYEEMEKQKNSILMEGTARFLDLDYKYSLLFDQSGRFIQKLTGPINYIYAFDGIRGWQQISTVVQPLEMDELESEQIRAWITTHRWLAKDSPFLIKVLDTQTNARTVALSIKLKGGLFENILFIDRSTWLPNLFILNSNSPLKDERQLLDYREEKSGMFVHHWNNSIHKFEIQSVTVDAKIEENPYQMPKFNWDDTKFHSDVSPDIEVKCEEGIVFVHPRINGKDVGWFVLDSGASGLILSPRAAQVAGMKPMGKIQISGAANISSSTFYQGTTFDLGPLTIQNPWFMSGSSESIFKDRNVVGSCGADVFDRAVIEIDWAKEHVRFYDPKQYNSKNLDWKELSFSGSKPYLDCCFEDCHHGLFLIDTGFSGSVNLNHRTVSQYQLLENQKTTIRKNVGFGGAQQIKIGNLDLFEFAGNRIKNPRAFFSINISPNDEIYCSGIIGAGLFCPYKTIFNYQQKKVAFIFMGNELKENAKKGDVQAQYYLGRSFYFGSMDEQNDAEAVAWYRKSAEQGNAEAQKTLGVMYKKGDGVAKDFNEAAKWYQKAAEQGNAKAQNALGVMYCQGEGISRDFTEAEKWYHKAAMQGNVDAQENLGMMYYHGQGVPQDFTEASKWFLESAELGNDEAQNNLGWMFQNGEGVSKDLTLAFQWYKKAADQGYSNAEYNLGYCYAQGTGVEKNFTEAIDWITKAAEQGYAPAQNYLGFAYYTGTGVAKDEIEAVKWYRKAADEGDSEGQRSLGIIYLNGWGVEKDESEAAKWLEKAAKQGDAKAQNKLGGLYMNGIGVAKDESEGIKWLHKAADQGDENAQKELERIAGAKQPVEQEKLPTGVP